MDETPMEPLPAPKPLDRIRLPRQSPWPVVIAVGMIVVLVAGVVYLFVKKPARDEPWRIDYPGVAFTSGEDHHVKEGKRYLQAEVKFDQDVVSAADFQNFLAQLVRQTKDTYVYYHIRARNRRGQHVMDGVADRNGQFSLTPGPEYESQGGPVVPPRPPGRTPLDNESGGTIIVE